jgi:hypothetical protein
MLKHDESHVLGLREQEGGLTRSERFQAIDVQNHEAVSRTGNETVALEAAQDPDHCLRRRADHIGHVLPRQPHRQPQPASFLDAASGTEIDQQRGQPLIGTI